MEIAGPVLLFDGECGLCVRCVRILLRADTHERLRFAPLQGRTAQAYLRERGLPTTDFDSIVFVPDWARRNQVPPRFRTEALFASFVLVGGVWRAFLWLRIFPATWRDLVYCAVARWRRRIFGCGDTNLLKERPEWAARLLE